MADPNYNVFGTETNPLALMWRSLPQNARNAYASVPNALAEFSPGAAIRDTLDASGRMVKSAVGGDGWGAAGAAANMLAAAAGVVPGARTAGKVGNAVATDVLPRIGAEGRVAGPYITEEMFKSLRDRYKNILYEASGGKDPRRIKLTDDRMAKAAELLSERHANRTTFMGSSSPRETTQQMRNAVAFAEEAIRRGHDVRFKVPDGPYGSLYVKTDDTSVRFSDHPQPTEGGKAVGGYSKTLGRRHHPADASVSPREMTLEEAMALLRKYGLFPALAGGALAGNSLATSQQDAY